MPCAVKCSTLLFAHAARGIPSNLPTAVQTLLGGSRRTAVRLYEYSWYEVSYRYEYLLPCLRALPPFLPAYLPAYDVVPLHGFLPSCQPSFLPPCMPLCMHACLPPHHAFLPACMPTFLILALPACLPSCLLACLFACLPCFRPNLPAACREVGQGRAGGAG